MGRSGPLPRRKSEPIWDSRLAYAVGLITADGCLSKDGRHIEFTSKDIEQVRRFKKCLNLKNKINSKRSGTGTIAYHTQFGDVTLYDFLLSIGLMPRKSKRLHELKIPNRYFSHFLRGLFDGDGTSYSYFDPVYKNSYHFYIAFASASPAFVVWLRNKIKNLISIKGSFQIKKATQHTQLRYAKKEALVLVPFLYADSENLHLRRKHLKIQASVAIINQLPEW